MPEICRVNPLFPVLRGVAGVGKFGCPEQEPQHVNAFSGIFHGAVFDRFL